MVARAILSLLLCFSLPTYGQGTRIDRLFEKAGCTNDTVNTILDYKGYKVVAFNECINKMHVNYRILNNAHSNIERQLCDSIISVIVSKDEMLVPIQKLEPFFQDSVRRGRDIDLLSTYVIQMVGFMNHGKKQIQFKLADYWESKWDTEYEKNDWKRRGQGGHTQRYGINYSAMYLYYDIESEMFTEMIVNGGRDTIAYPSEGEYCEQTFWRLSESAREVCTATQLNLDSLDKKEIEIFLQVITPKLRSNVEHSQWSNELLFKVLQKYPSEVLSILDSYSSRIDMKYILEELRNPIHDLIPLDEVLRVVKVSDSSSRTDDVVKALEYAKSKNE